MAASYHVVSQFRDVQVLSATLVNDVQQVGIVTQPTGIFVQYPVQLAQWQQNEGLEVLSLLAEQIESIISGGLAVDASFGQDLDDSGLIVDFLDFLVAYRSPNPALPLQTTTVRIAVGALTGFTDPFVAALATSPTARILAAWEQLQTTASL